MRSLEASQQAFAEALDRAALADGDLSMLAGEPLLARRFALYRANVDANVLRALRNAFPVLAHCVGDAAFAALARAYGREHPSRDGDLNRMGALLPAFVASYAPLTAQAYLPELATLEWSVHRAHYAADAGTLDLARLAAVPPERYGELRLALDAAVALFRFDWQLSSPWNLFHDDATQPCDVRRGRERVIVLRPRYRVVVRTIEAAEHACLEACARGASLESAVDRALAIDAAFALDATLRRWVGERVVVDCSLP